MKISRISLSIETVIVITTLLIRFSTQLNINQQQSFTYQLEHFQSVDTNELNINDDDPCLIHYCPKGMECILTNKQQPKCICQRECLITNKRKRRHHVVCGSNGKIYSNYCELNRDNCITGDKVIFQTLSKCLIKNETTAGAFETKKGEQKQPSIVDSCTIQQYEIMKDNVLLFNHNHLVFPKVEIGDDLNKKSHSKEFLVSIIFSHYDQNNDGLLEYDELLSVWNEEKIIQIKNGDNDCSLVDLLRYDDTNNDFKLTINEFNQAFSQLSSGISVTLDKALEINHLSVRIGDNVEIKCDIIGRPKSPTIIWQRYNYDLTLMNYTINGDDRNQIDEIRLMSGSFINIQNIQLKHAGNYTCHATSDKNIIQTHILTVHTLPIMLVSPNIQSRRPGESAKIYCNVIGEVLPYLKWLKNEEPISVMDQSEKYEMIGNGTVMKINNLVYSDTGAYTCVATGTSGTGTITNFGTLIIQNDPTPTIITHEQNFFVFHDGGISIYESSICRLEHHIKATDLIPGTQEFTCNQETKRCDWGKAINVADESNLNSPNSIDLSLPHIGLIYITQPYLNRILVISVLQRIVIEIIDTDKCPLNLFYDPVHDQIWLLSWHLKEDGKEEIEDSKKTIQIIRDVKRVHRKHLALHPQAIDNKFDLVKNLFVPTANFNENVLMHYFDFRYGYVTHHNQRGIYKLDLKELKYTRYIDLTLFNCVPEHILFSGLYGFVIVSCYEPVTKKPQGQLVLDYLTDSIIPDSIKPDLVGVPHISPDSKHLITIHYKESCILISVQQVTSNGLVFSFDVETTLIISDITFVKSTSSMGYDMFATTDKDDVLCLNLDTGKVEMITSVGETSISTWFNSVRPIRASGVFSDTIITPSKDALFVISSQTRTINCEIKQLSNPSVIIWG